MAAGERQTNPRPSQERPEQERPARERIVSSAHLVSEQAAELSEVEYGLIVASNAFGVWTVRGTAAAQAEFPEVADLGMIDILSLHSVNHRGRPKRLADICFKLNVEDTHIVNYAVKKLIKAGLITGQKQGKEVFYETSNTGKAVIRRYRDIREACLVDAFSALGEVDPDSLGELARQLCGAAWPQGLLGFFVGAGMQPPPHARIQLTGGQEHGRHP